MTTTTERPEGATALAAPAFPAALVDDPPTVSDTVAPRGGAMTTGNRMAALDDREATA